jgi:hypothetical protein
MDTDDLTWIMYGYQEFGSDSLNPVLNPRGTRVKQNAGKLIQTCGDEYVIHVKKASQRAAVFTLHSLNKTTKSTLAAHFDGGASWSAGQVSFSANFKNFLSEASQHGSIEVKIFGFGSGGLGKLSDIVANGDRFDNVRNTIAHYLSTEMTASTAAPISFTTASFGDLAEPPLSTTPVGDPPELDSIYLEYGNTLARIRRIEDMVGGRNGAYG